MTDNLGQNSDILATYQDRDTRILTMIKEFPKLREQGLTITQIAKKFRLSVSNMYYTHLRQIAKYYGVERSELLDKHYKTKNMPKHEPCQQRAKLSVQEILGSYQHELAKIKEFQQEVQNHLNQPEPISYI